MSFRPIGGRWGLALLFLLTEGCVSFVFSRFAPDPSEHGSDTCGGYAPIADVAIGIGTSVLCAYGNARFDAAPGDPRGPFQVTPCIPFFIDLASIAYGITAEVVCTVRARSNAGDHAAARP